MKTNFDLVESNSEDHHAILINSGPFQGVKYQYNWIKIPENIEESIGEDGNVPLSFHYEVLSNPHNHNTDSEEFQNEIGDILVTLASTELGGF